MVKLAGPGQCPDEILAIWGRPVVAPRDERLWLEQSSNGVKTNAHLVLFFPSECLESPKGFLSSRLQLAGDSTVRDQKTGINGWISYLGLKKEWKEAKFGSAPLKMSDKTRGLLGDTM